MIQAYTVKVVRNNKHYFAVAYIKVSENELEHLTYQKLRALLPRGESIVYWARSERHDHPSASAGTFVEQER